MEQLRSDLLDLVQIPGPSGYEGEVAKWISPKIQPYFSKVEIDGMGNLLAIKEGPPGAKVFVAMAHMDEVSMVVTYAGDGFIRFDYVGSINPAVVVGQPVRVLTQSGPIPGVVCSPSVHLGQRVGELWIDVGPRANRVEPGDPIIFDTTPRWLDDEKKVLATKAADDRTGCAILIDTARRLANMDFGITLIFAFTVQEEVGLRGARVAAYAEDPDAAVVLECTAANEVPNRRDMSPSTQLGQGPAVTIMDNSFIADPQLVEHFLSLAASKGIPVQVKQPNIGGTDAGAIQRTRRGVAAITLAVPARYIHSAASIMNAADFDYMKALAREAMPLLEEALRK